MCIRVKRIISTLIILSSLLMPLITDAAIALDRTRVIVDGGNRSVSLSIVNNNHQLPYLAQAWLEDSMGKKINTPLVVLPPIQRVEPGATSQIKIEVLPAVNTLPTDRETLYYFNLREIPPNSDKQNALQIALQTKIKLFYRPHALKQTMDSYNDPFQEKLKLLRKGNNYLLDNPTGHYITIIDASNGSDNTPVKNFEPMMIPPMSSMKLEASVQEIGNQPILEYVNDFGGHISLSFSCQGNVCRVVSPEKKTD